MRQKQKKSSPKPPPSQACTQPEEGLESFLEEIRATDEGDLKPVAADSRRVGAGGEGKESDDDELFKGYVKDDKMDTEDEKGDDEEEPGKIKDESGSDDDSNRKPAGMSTRQAEGEDDTNSEMSWWDEHAVVPPCEPSIDKAALVKVFTGVLKIDVACVRF